MRRLLDVLVFFVLVAMLAGAFVGSLVVTPAAAQGGLSEPRIEPLAGGVDGWPAGSRDAFDAVVGPGDADSPTHLVATLARYPEGLKRLTPLAVYLREGAMATAVDQVLLALRVAWLCGSEAVWAEQAAVARDLGLSSDELRRVAEGPDAGWGQWDATVLRAADELYRDAFLGGSTWDVMATRYNARQMIDATLTAAESIMRSVTANALGVQPDARFGDRFPEGVVRGNDAPPPSHERLEAASERLDSAGKDDWVAQRRELLDPILDAAASTLSSRARGLLVLRMAWLCAGESCWAQTLAGLSLSGDEIERIEQGPDAPGWEALDAALLAAADELFRDDTIGAATWETLAGEYADQELVEIVITAAGARMVSVAMNSLEGQR